MAHDVELRVRVRRAVRTAARATRQPAVADEPLREVELTAVEHLAGVDLRPTDEELEHAHVLGCCVEDREEGLQLGPGPVSRRRIVRHRTMVAPRSPPGLFRSAP
ncbi:MAG: hypothetical protein IPO89_13680 [Actinomycetales bacterium]|nr:hypothetical protein [Candidatus Lutibacillus vidarii]